MSRRKQRMPNEFRKSAPSSPNTQTTLKTTTEYLFYKHPPFFTCANISDLNCIDSYHSEVCHWVFSHSSIRGVRLLPEKSQDSNLTPTQIQKLMAVLLAGRFHYKGACFSWKMWIYSDILADKIRYAQQPSYVNPGFTGLKHSDKIII